MTENDDRTADIGTAMGRIPSGVSILTAAAEGDSTGMIASWVQQASMEPLMLTVAVKTGRHINDLIARSNHFVLNIAGQDASNMFKHFGKGFEPGADAFIGLNIDRTDAGVRLGDAIATIDCRVVQSVTAGDHVVHIAEAIGGSGDTTSAPFVHIRKTALGY